MAARAVFLSLMATAVAAAPWGNKAAAAASKVADAVPSAGAAVELKPIPAFAEGPVALVNDLAQQLQGVDDATIFLSSAAALVALFAGASLLLSASASDQGRRKSWVVTAASSLVMSFTGSYFALRLYVTRGTILLPDFQDIDNEVDGTIAKAICLFFLAYCVVDTAFCALFYGANVNVGFQHHTIYAALLVYLLRSGQTLLFAVGALEELPTLILSLYELMGDTRPRLPTGLAIFFVRVTYHLYITYKASELLNTPLFFFSAYLLLHHIAWFRSWFIKRVEAVKSESEAIGSHDASKAAAKQKKLKLEVTTHVYLVSFVLVAQALMHGYLVCSQLAAFAPTKRDWTERGSALALLLVDLSGHAVCFLLVTARMVGIVQDVYTEHFIMHTIEKRSIIYNISWEDPRVERELLSIGKDDVILTISSAGCNVLDYLCTSPKAIVACDFNQAQLAMLELKLACIKHLDHARFWAIWAESDIAVFRAEWPGLRAKILADPKSTTKASTVAFWDENEAVIKDNVMFAGSSGLAARLMMPFMRFLGIVDHMEKRKCYPPASMSLAILTRILQSELLWAWVAPLGGVPESQLALIKREPHVWAERLEEVLCRRMWMPDNYFYYAYLAGRWDEKCCPPYMERANFPALQAAARRGAVTLVHGGWADGAQTRDDFTVASLLDSMDWMPDSMIAENIARLYPHMSDGTKKGAKQGVIFWRSFATKVHSPVLAALRPDHVPDDDGRERVGWYLSQWVAPVRPHAAVDFSRLLAKGSGAGFANTAGQDAKVLVAMALHALRSEKDSVEFYKSQGDAYDGFREALLPDRDLLQHYCLPWHEAPKTWVSVGCGTARDIEYVIGHLRDTKTHLFLLDLSPALLEMAKQRVEKYGLQGQVTLVVANLLEAFGADGRPNKKALRVVGGAKRDLPALGEADVVTCSYCLTMIPPWKEALGVMVRMLARGGTLALIDFTKREDKPGHWTQALNGWWFAHDGVYFDEAHTAWLKAHPELRTIWYHEAESRVPFTPLQATHYLWTGIKV